MSSTANTGAQVTIIGVNHIDKIRLTVPMLLKTKMVVNCANDTLGGILGVFYAKIHFHGKYWRSLDVFRQTSQRLDSLIMQTWHT